MATERIRLGGNYRKLYTATALSNIGDGMSAIAYPWLATAITRNPLLIALVAAAQRLPWLVFTLPAGVITDRAVIDQERRGEFLSMSLVDEGATSAVVSGALPDRPQIAVEGVSALKSRLLGTGH